jgi:hypothetical protein
MCLTRRERTFHPLGFTNFETRRDSGRVLPETYGPFPSAGPFTLE